MTDKDRDLALRLRRVIRASGGTADRFTIAKEYGEADARSLERRFLDHGWVCRFSAAATVSGLRAMEEASGKRLTPSGLPGNPYLSLPPDERVRAAIADKGGREMTVADFEPLVHLSVSKIRKTLKALEARGAVASRKVQAAGSYIDFWRAVQMEAAE